MSASSSIGLSAAVLARELREANLDWQIVDRTTSTNADLVARARAQAPRRPALLAADEQTAGRGRHGRAWLAAPGSALLFSVALPWRRAPADSAAVTLACGLAIAQCLEQSRIGVQLKWPNDVLLDGGKLGGILTELTEDAGGARTLVVGLGLNLLLDEAQRLAIGQPAAALAQALGPAAATARERWLARLALALIGAAEQFDRLGFAGVCADFNRYCAYRGQTVTLHADGQTARQGTVIGVDELGRLLFECDGQILTIISGAVSLRASRPNPV